MYRIQYSIIIHMCTPTFERAQWEHLTGSDYGEQQDQDSDGEPRALPAERGADRRRRQVHLLRDGRGSRVRDGRPGRRATRRRPERFPTRSATTAGGRSSGAGLHFALLLVLHDVLYIFALRREPTAAAAATGRRHGERVGRAAERRALRVRAAFGAHTHLIARQHRRPQSRC